LIATCVLIELSEAKHYTLEDAPERISETIIDRIG
jgi:hypothetical protein